MTITFFSNFLNDHQLPFCKEMVKRLGEDNFHFVAHERIDPERIAMGFADMNELYSFVIKSYEDNEQDNKAKELMLNSDVVIIGSYRNMPFDERMRRNKLTFRYNERLLKTGDWRWIDPRVQKSVWTQWTKYRNKPLYELCASAYTARDLSLFGFPKNKCFKWGYFPVVKEYDDIESMMKAKRQNVGLKHPQDVSILWVARLIGLKHPEYPIKIAKRLKAEGYRFHLDMIGIGNMHDCVQSMISEYDLQDCVRLLGGMPPAEVRKHMEKAEIFLFTSDKNEGWGAVLNESLNSGCAVVANRAIGSVPFLLSDGNGLVYDNNIESAYQCVKRLMDDENLRYQLGKAGYETMTEEWSASKATSNLFELIGALQRDEADDVIEHGPCSKID